MRAWRLITNDKIVGFRTGPRPFVETGNNSVPLGVSGLKLGFEVSAIFTDAATACTVRALSKATLHCSSTSSRSV